MVLSLSFGRVNYLSHGTVSLMSSACALVRVSRDASCTHAVGLGASHSSA